MKKVIFGIFAHPDDEAFGPSGTLLKLRQDGYDLHLILLTDGEAGVNIDTVSDLGETRLAEWRAATRLLGAQTAHALHYPDGALETVAPAELDAAVGKVIEDLLATYAGPIAASLMTFEPHGLTGHRDHIAASQLTERIATRLPVHDVWYFCLDRHQAPLDGTTYYEPRAREDNYITTRINISEQLADKYHVMDVHYSQRGDAASIKALGDERLSYECFHVEN